jgi:hypothetical protein
MDVKAMLGDRLPEEDALLLSQGIANGYLALDKFLKKSIALSEYLPGMRHRGYLLGIFAQHGVEQIAAQQKRFFSTIKPNVARNHFHSHFETESGVHFTTQYRGRDGTRGVKKALYRAALCVSQGDLFASESNKPNISPLAEGPIYSILLHGGWISPVSIMLAIPDGNQRTFSARPYALPIVQAKRAEAEEIAENFEFKKNISDHGKDSDSTKSA